MLKGVTLIDFVNICTRMSTKRKNQIEIYPDFSVSGIGTTDLMVRGGRFFAVWDEENRVWSKNEYRVADMIDNLIREKYDSMMSDNPEGTKIVPLYMRNFSSGSWLSWIKYSRSLPDNYHKLNNKIIFADATLTKRDYASFKLHYSLNDEPTPAYDELISTLYSPSERQKLEWAIGSIIAGDSKKLQKFLVIFGEGGTGKGTILDIIQRLFTIPTDNDVEKIGYCAPFSSKELGNSSSQFAFEQFNEDPLVAIDNDGDLAHIDDNTKLNQLVSHELVNANEKYRSKYKTRYKAFLFIATNSPVKITDAKSGIIRRLIDVYPTGNKLDGRKYNRLFKQIDFELGGIAKHCLDVYEEAGYHYYDHYIPQEMLTNTNYFYNFIDENELVFTETEMMTLNQAWRMYQEYCKDANVSYPLTKMVFKSELKNYYGKFEERAWNGKDRLRNVYSEFLIDKFKSSTESKKPNENASSEDKGSERDIPEWLQLKKCDSVFDNFCAESVSQYDSGHNCPKYKWVNVSTKLKDLVTTRLHYVKLPINHIVIDFDLTDSEGNKSLDANLNAAKDFPPTYAEVSKSGQGLHLHYIYDGNAEELAYVYSPGIEIKVFSGNSSLRRKYSLSNGHDISHISSGLPKREAKKVLNEIVIKNDKALINLIKKHLRKEIVPSTRQSIDLIYSILEECYDKGMEYDVSALYPMILHFAMCSTHQSDYCMAKVGKMKLSSKEHREDSPTPAGLYNGAPIAFFDIEVFPNVYMVCYKILGEDLVLRLINPTAVEIDNLVHSFRLVGFNNRNYDNHILYGIMLGLKPKGIYELSSRLVSGLFGQGYMEAYNLSYMDLYDISSKKQSLKKWEIELGIHHHENAYDWNTPLDKSHWEEICDYCCDDVRATESVYNAIEQDIVAREILASWSGLSVNSSTRMHATKIIFGDEKHPKLNYVDLSVQFPGYVYDHGVSTYRDEITGEGGYVYAEPGIYYNVALLDIASMHPHSILAMNMFGDYTVKFKNLVDCRIHIKKKEYDDAKQLLPENVWKYLTDENSKALSFALKIVINSIYGYTKAHFENPFKDERNVDNIVAKRGALFMINLKHEVQSRGFKVAHIKTDSIKIPDATPEIIQFVMDYGESYGYFFEHEATYERMCLVNDAVYVARHEDGTWTATGTQFQVPYVFKTLFSKEPITFNDMCEIKSVTSSLYLDFDEGLPEGEHRYVFVGRIGLFCPVKDGYGGGRLLRLGKDKNGDPKYDSVSGAKGYRWLESETMDSEKDISKINLSYYDSLVIAAKEAIDKFGDVEQFIFN